VDSATADITPDPLEIALVARESELAAAVGTAFDQARRNPTGANRKAWDNACKALDLFRKERGDTGSGEKLLFDGPPEALAWLESEQWKVGKSKLYDDLKTGIIARRPDGTITREELEQYTRCLSKQDGTPGNEAKRSLSELKTLQEIDRVRVDREHRELRLEVARGELIPRSDVEIELAKRAGYLRSDLKNVFRALAGEIVTIVKGDPAAIPQLITWGAGQGGTVDEIMDRYSRPIRGFEDE
jgi:hypothetical protein